jgi:hypothetical protein
MPVTKKFTPSSLITSILALAGFGSLLFGVSNHFVSKAEAADIIARQQASDVQTDLDLVDLEIKFLESEARDHPEDADDILKKVEFLKKKQEILMKYQLELQGE